MVFVPAADSMEESVSSVIAGMKTRNALASTGLASSGTRIFSQTANAPLPPALAASSSAGSTVSIAFTLPLIWSTR